MQSLLSGVAGGNELAVAQLWKQYSGRLARLARRKLGSTEKRMCDEEDVALSAFDTFCRAVAEGRFSRLKDPSDLWKLLATITIRKAIEQVRYTHRLKRGGGEVCGESALTGTGGRERYNGIGQIAGTIATPDCVAEMKENCIDLLGSLHDSSLRTIALLKLERYSNREIAERLGYNVRTVEKKLARIRQKWQQATPAERD